MDKKTSSASVQRDTHASRTRENLNCSFNLNFDPIFRKCLRGRWKRRRIRRECQARWGRKPFENEELLHKLEWRREDFVATPHSVGHFSRHVVNKLTYSVW